MEKNTIPIIIALFSIALLLSFDNLKFAYALTITDVALPITPDVVVYAPSVDRYLYYNSGDAVQVVNPDTKQIITTYALTGIDDISCDSVRCYTGVSGASDGNSFVIGFNPLSGAVETNSTFNFASGAYSAIDDTVAGTNKLIAHDGRVYWLSICDNGDLVMIIAEGNNNAGLIGDCAGTNIGSGITTLGMVVYENKIAITTDALSPSTNGFQIWLQSGGRVCVGGAMTLGTGGNVAYSETTDRIYLTTASSQRVDIMNADTCADTGDITSAQHGLSTLLRGIQVNDDREEIYIQSTTHVAVQDLNTPTANLYTFSAGGDAGTSRDKTAISTNQYTTAFSTTARIVDLDALSSGGGDGGIDCTLPENENILICRLGGTGAFGSAGAFVIGEVPTNTTDGTGLTGIGCAIGLVDCISDPNIQTNGLGLLIFIASIFIVVGMFVSTQGLQNTIKLPVYMWAMIIIALSAFFTITQIIDPVFLIISIIGLIALGAPKIVNTFKGGSTFGSGSTE